jgi:hypothetical protein
MNTSAIARGKHSKIRKMKEKYADQDEEERKMRMQLIGTKDVTGFDLSKHQELTGALTNVDIPDSKADDDSETGLEAVPENT